MAAKGLIDALCPYGCGFSHIPIPSSQPVMDMIGYTWLIMAAIFVSVLARSIFFRKGHIVDVLLRNMRARQARNNLPAKRGSIIDVGCGSLDFLNSVKFKKKTGIDIMIPRIYDEEALAGLNRINNNSADCITFIASLEHITDTGSALKRSYEVLKKEGRIIITLPTKASRMPLEIISSLRIIEKKMIDEHKHYHGRDEIVSLLRQAGFKNIRYRLFELGFNSLITAEK